MVRRAPNSALTVSLALLAVSLRPSTGEQSAGLYWQSGEGANPVAFQNPEPPGSFGGEGAVFVPASGAGSAFAGCQSTTDDSWR
jgi:hypothetical protein